MAIGFAFSTLVATSGAATALGAGAVALWATRTARPEAAEATEPAVAPKLPAGGAEAGALVAVVVAAALALIAPLRLSGDLFSVLTALLLLAGALVRGYRLGRPGPPVLDRLAAVLALVPSSALLVGALFMVLRDASSRWMTFYAAAGVLALAAGLRWRRSTES
jgi:hypothetical protein